MRIYGMCHFNNEIFYLDLWDENDKKERLPRSWTALKYPTSVYLYIALWATCYSPDDTPHWENKLEKCSKLHQAEDDLLEWTIKMSDAHAVHWITLLQRHGVRGKQRPGIPHPQWHQTLLNYCRKWRHFIPFNIFIYKTFGFKFKDMG